MRTIEFIYKVLSLFTLPDAKSVRQLTIYDSAYFETFDYSWGDSKFCTISYHSIIKRTSVLMAK